MGGGSGSGSGGGGGRGSGSSSGRQALMSMYFRIELLLADLL